MVTGAPGRPSRLRRGLVAVVLLGSVWALGLWVARRWQFDGWFIRTWLLVPSAASIALAVLPWRVEPNSPRGRGRLWAAIGIAVVLCIPAVFFLSFMIWALGPDCGVVASGAVRGRYVAVALALGASVASLPVAIAGRRPATLAVGGIPIGILTLVGLAAAASSDPGWCLF